MSGRDGGMARNADMFTAIVFSRQPIALSIPGVTVLNSVQTVTGPEGMLAARLDVLSGVKTPWCFYLDDDDELPDDYLSVLNECAAADKPLAYTNELVRQHAHESIRRSAPYSQEAHLKNMLLVHSLAVMRTEDAKRAAQNLPRGRYWAEMLLFWQLAKGGAQWLDRVGHIWNRGGGLNTKPWTLESQVRSAIWCANHRN